jgi:protein dithiol oxidoreductase (disulfide-forming)
MPSNHTLNRRDFSNHMLAGGLSLVASGAALAQATAPAEGKDYVRLSTPAAVATLPAGKKVDVVEFFWYGCPHCDAFEPTLEAWVKKLPADVAFRRVHVGFGAAHQIHQKLFYALEEMDQLQALHRKVFDAMHRQSKRLLTDAEISAFGAANGVDGTKLVETMKSFSVTTKATRAKQLSEAYKIDGVPALGIQGRYYTSGSLAGSLEQALKTADYLIGRSRG